MNRIDAVPCLALAAAFALALAACGHRGEANGTIASTMPPTNNFEPFGPLHMTRDDCTAISTIATVPSGPTSMDVLWATHRIRTLRDDAETEGLQ